MLLSFIVRTDVCPPSGRRAAGLQLFTLAIQT